MQVFELVDPSSCIFNRDRRLKSIKTLTCCRKIDRPNESGFQEENPERINQFRLFEVEQLVSGDQY
jgi:hypothetical protein